MTVLASTVHLAVADQFAVTVAVVAGLTGFQSLNALFAGTVGVTNAGMFAVVHAVPWGTTSVSCLPSALLVHAPNPVVGKVAFTPKCVVPALSVIVRFTPTHW